MTTGPAARKIRAVFLDFGGTLVGGSPDPYEAWRPVFARREIRIDHARWDAATDRALTRLGPLQYEYLGRQPTFWDVVHSATLEELDVADPDGEIVRELHDIATSPAARPPFPETEEVLRALADRGLALHVLSNNTDYLIESLARLGWTDRFASATFSQEAGAEKPDARIFALAVRRAGCAPHEVLHVGDSWTADYDGARRAGLGAAWLNRDGRPAPEPSVTMSDLRGIEPLLDA
jgi:putative hydrolase of the HAD superfamily